VDAGAAAGVAAAGAAWMGVVAWNSDTPW
jgi:hypothetical protein